MKPEVTLKYLSYLRNKKKNGEEGFTLIELLVVVIIIGVLAAVALPNLLGQVGKARESEGKNAMGTLNRTQQAYHFERQTFVSVTNANLALPTNPLGVVVTSTYYTLDTTALASEANSLADATNATGDGVREYAGSVSFNAGAYSSVLCQSANITGTAGATGGNTCAAGNIVVK